jgi:hypothetical protein
VLEPTLRELMEEAGCQDIRIEADEKKLRGKGKFHGTKKELKNRIRGELELIAYNGHTGDLHSVICRPPS